MRFYFVLLVCLACSMFFHSTFAQNSGDSARNTVWGNDKVVDGKLDEWSPVIPPEHGSADNERYFFDSGADDWNDPQGGDLDQPLPYVVCLDHPITLQPEAVATGFNIWGFYVCYEPYHADDHKVYVAIDLPMSSNSNVSADFEHPYNNASVPSYIFRPIAFDADGNGNQLTVQSDDDFPGGTNPFNYIVPLPQFFVDDDNGGEHYEVWLYFGDKNWPGDVGVSDDFDVPDGLPIVMRIRSLDGVIQPFEAFIPGEVTKSGDDVDLLAEYPGAILMGGLPPNPHAPTPVVDLEFGITNLKTIYEDDRFIDWSKITTGKFPESDLRYIDTIIHLGAEHDETLEVPYIGSFDFPLLPFKATVEKFVYCIKGEESEIGAKKAHALPNTTLRYEIVIDVPLEYEPGKVNGEGTIGVVDDCYYYENLNKNHIPNSHWKVLNGEVTLNGETGKIDCSHILPDSEEYIIKYPGGDPMIFKGGDVIVIPVEIDTSFLGPEEGVDPDIENEIYVNARNLEDPPVVFESDKDTVYIDVIQFDMTLEKLVQIMDNNGNYYPNKGTNPFGIPDLSEDGWWNPTYPGGLPELEFPVTVYWTFEVANSSEYIGKDYLVISKADFDGKEYGFTDYVLAGIPGIIPTPNPTPPHWNGSDSIKPDELYRLIVAVEFATYKDYLMYCNAEGTGQDYDEIHNTKAADPQGLGLVAEWHVDPFDVPSPILLICYDDPDLYRQSESKVYVPSPDAKVSVTKGVSCEMDGPFADSVMSFPDTWVYYQIIVTNVKSTVAVDHCYIEDVLAGEYTDWELIEGPLNFAPNQYVDIGPLALAGQPGDSITIKYKVLTDPNYDDKGVSPDITNTVYVEADGPDIGTEPDLGSGDVYGPVEVDILFGEITIIKRVTVNDSGGGSWGPEDDAVILPDTVVYPITITWDITVENISEPPITPDIYVHDDLLAQLGTPPPWSIPAIPINNPQDLQFIHVVPTPDDADDLDSIDVDGQDGIIHNISYIGDVNGDYPILLTQADVCGVLPLEAEDDAKIVLPGAYEIPALHEWGMLAMLLVFSGLILVRARRGI